MDRLAPIRKANPSGTWQQWVIQAYFQRISLSTTGFYMLATMIHSNSTHKTKCFTFYIILERQVSDMILLQTAALLSDISHSALRVPSSKWTV